MEILGYVFAIFMGLSLGLIGGGGSILTVPILVYFFGQDGVVATTGSLFVVGATALVGAVMSARRGLVDFKTGLLFAVPSFFGVSFSRRVLLPLIPEFFSLTPDIAMSKSLLILIFFAILMIAASRTMIRSGKKTISSGPIEPHGLLSVGVKGFLVGATTGFVGAGGGFLIIPALAVLLGLPMRVAVGTSLAIIAANSLFGFLISFGDQPLAWNTLALVTGLGIAGLLAGHRFAHRVPEAALKKGFGYFVLVVGVFVLINQSLKLM